jgi:hypothetical protein
MSNRSSVASCNFGALTGMMGRLTQRWLDAQPYPDHTGPSLARSRGDALCLEASQVLGHQGLLGLHKNRPD